MGLFSRREAPPGPTQPFEFVVEHVFAVPMRGLVFTGHVTSGQVQRGQDAVLHLPGGAHAVRVKRIDVRKRSASVVGTGAEAGLYLDSVSSNDLPSTPRGDSNLIDNDAIAGTRITSA
ncbi:hypothetical protein ABT324_03015 [Saccharopolyspora sp. NPDC000359]|uniref:hypothetical protein n=1 Tax=Saccharopolyspora sp. NPDC000359 TaxID=3154251 RepID=UPI003321B77D